MLLNIIILNLCWE